MNVARKQDVKRLRAGGKMMNDRMPCGLEDDRIRFEPDEPEEESPMTDMEKRISWLCDDWAEALRDDTYDTWRDVRMMIYGATQSLVDCKGRFDDIRALHDLGNIAFDNGLECIRAGKYEGAPNESHA